MSLLGQSLPKRDVRVKSVHPSISDMMLQRRDTSKWAMCGRLRVVKDFDHDRSVGRCSHDGMDSPAFHVAGWWDDRLATTRGGGYGYQGDWTRHREERLSSPRRG